MEFWNFEILEFLSMQIAFAIYKYQKIFRKFYIKDNFEISQLHFPKFKTFPDQKSRPIAKYHIGFPLNSPFISQAASTRRKYPSTVLRAPKP